MTSTSIYDIRNMNDCLVYVNNLEMLCIASKTSPMRCERMKQNLLEYCNTHFNINNSTNKKDCIDYNSNIEKSCENPYSISCERLKYTFIEYCLKKYK